MKIGIVCYPTFGGSGVLATELGIHLSKRGHEIHFISYQRPARLSTFHKSVFFHEVNALDYPLFEFTPYDSALTSKMVDVAIHEKLDLFHVHYAIPHAAAGYLARDIIMSKIGKYIPMITTLHGTDITIVGNDPSYRPVVEFSMNKSDGLTAVSCFLEEKTRNLFDMRRDIEVIHNFIDYERFQLTEEEKTMHRFVQEDEFVITHMSNFRKVKRVEDAVAVFDKIQKVHKARLVLIGDGPDRTLAEAKCRELKLCDKVMFLGKVDAIEEVLNNSDLFLLPSSNESFGLAALEAMACGVAVISSNAEGIPEVNVHGETGYMCDVGDVDNMAKHAISLLDNPEKLAQFKENARTRAKGFDIDNIVPHYEQYYSRVYDEVNSLSE